VRSRVELVGLLARLSWVEPAPVSRVA